MKLLRLLAAVAPLFATALWAADASGHGITTPESLFPQLDTILKQAVAQSPQMVAHAVDDEMAENDRIVARAALLPTVSGYYRFTESKDKRADLADRTNVEKQNYDFSLNQPLFFWGERRNTARMGEIRAAIAHGNVREGYRILAQEIRAQYLRLIIGKARVKRAAFYAGSAETQKARGEERLAAKVISDAQIFSIRIEAERAQIADERARFDYENDKASFARLTGQPVLADENIPDTIPAFTPQTEQLQALLAGYLSQAENPSHEAATLRQSMQVEKLSLANAKTRLRPKVSLIAGASEDQQAYTVNVASKYQVQSLYAGVSVNWTVFDGFAAGAAQRSAYARVRQQENEYRQLTERLAATAQSQVRVAGFSARYVSISDRYLQSSFGGLKAKQEEFSRGVASQEDVNQMQVGNYDSEINALTSRADYYTQVCEFLGTVVEDPVLANLAK